MEDDIPWIPQNPSILWWFLLKVTQEAVEIKREIQRNCELNETLKKTVKQRKQCCWTTTDTVHWDCSQLTQVTQVTLFTTYNQPQLTQIKLVHNRHQPQVTQINRHCSLFTVHCSQLINHSWHCSNWQQNPFPEKWQPFHLTSNNHQRFF